MRKRDFCWFWCETLKVNSSYLTHWCSVGGLWCTRATWPLRVQQTHTHLLQSNSWLSLKRSPIVGEDSKELKSDWGGGVFSGCHIADYFAMVWIQLSGRLLRVLQHWWSLCWDCSSSSSSVVVAFLSLGYSWLSDWGPANWKKPWRRTGEGRRDAVHKKQRKLLWHYAVFAVRLTSFVHLQSLVLLFFHDKFNLNSQRLHCIKTVTPDFAFCKWKPRMHVK